MPGRARDEVLARIELGPASGLFRLVASQLYTSAIPADFSGTAIIGSRSVWDVSAVLDLAQLPWLGTVIPGEELLVSVTANNITDQSIRDTQFFPQPGRSIAFRVEWRL